MHEIVERANSATWVADEDGTMAGFAIVEWFDRSGETIAYIETIEVAKEHRRRGIAAGLLERIELSARQAGATQIWLHVYEKNDAAIRLYRTQGYLRQGRRAHYYARNRNAEIYRKHLTS
jgi:ribosomal-protein-alanine N-acetyltransferase